MSDPLSSEVELEQIANLLGVGSAFAIALPFYLLFKFLDQKASDDAKAAVGSWIKGDAYKSLSLGDAIGSAFDHVYGYRLLHPFGFIRSAFLTSVAVCLYELYLTGSFEGMGAVLAIVLLPIIVSDYLSLFAVRKALELGRSSLSLAVILALFAGVFAVSIVVFVEIRIVDHLFGFLEVFGGPPTSISSKISQGLKFMAPAILVHLWLPMFLIGGLMNYMLRLFFRSVDVAQWFIAKGDQSPLEAIGVMASIFVFVVALMTQRLSAFV